MWSSGADAGLSDDHPMAANGYIEEEYLVSGKANVYDWGTDNKAVVRTANAPYTTRMIVRRPINPARFSGTAVVEPLNPSNLFDLNIGWAMSGDQFMRNGDVWVGFTSKPVAVQALKKFDSGRYGSLSQIARAITGTSWSGPVFFGLKPRPAPRPDHHGGGNGAG